MENENAPYLAAVSERIADSIVAFCKTKLEGGGQFHADQLRKFVDSDVDGGCAPASADRVLRDLRQRGMLGYKVLNRRQSLYVVDFVS